MAKDASFSNRNQPLTLMLLARLHPMKFAPAAHGRPWDRRRPGGICAWCTCPTKKGMVCLC